MKVTVEPLVDKPIIHVSDSSSLGGNVNGPCLIRVPDWVDKPLGKYYLYFAHHEGKSIRLAYANRLTGPWTLHEPGALSLENSLFPTTEPKREDLHPVALEWIRTGGDGVYPHIASPDVIIDEEMRQIRLYYHGRLSNGIQETRVAISAEGLNFTPRDEIIGNPYMRIFRYGGYWYGVAMPGDVYRSHDGLTNFESGGKLFEPSVRHCGLLRRGDTLYCFWTRVGDSPERILMSTVDLTQPWQSWKDSSPVEIRRPRLSWEGAGIPAKPSTYGTDMNPVNELRDPYVFVEGNADYLLWSVAGEQGLGIGRIYGLN